MAAVWSPPLLLTWDFLSVRSPYLPWTWAPPFLWNLAVLWNSYRDIGKGRQKESFNDWKLCLRQINMTKMCRYVLVLILFSFFGGGSGTIPRAGFWHRFFFPFCFHVHLERSVQRISKWEDSTSFVLLNDCWQRLLRRDKSLSLRASERLSLLSSVSFNHLQASQLP